MGLLSRSSPMLGWQTSQSDRAGWNKRADGTEKGDGWLGQLQRPDGMVSTEISVGLDFGKGETQIPVLVPTLTPDEVRGVLAMNPSAPDFWTSLSPDIRTKVVTFAQGRLAQGKSPFAGPEEYPQNSATPRQP